jgi:hypothetical protein
LSSARASVAASMRIESMGTSAKDRAIIASLREAVASGA